MIMVFMDAGNYVREKGFVTPVFSGRVSVGCSFFITKSNFTMKLS